LLIVAVATRELTGKPMFLRTRLMVTLGTWSYSFYLVHATVLYGLSQIWFGKQPPSWSNVPPLLISLAAAIVLSAALYRFVEHPAEKALRKALPRPNAPTATPQDQRV
jgi:peptidoglycan/LPS O-acetylase OafA/YrhL